MVATLPFPPMPSKAEKPARVPHFDLLESARDGGSYAATVTVSMFAHVALAAIVVIVPLLLSDELVPTTTAVRAFFVAPADVMRELPQETAIDLGVEGGMPGGVEGGVAGGVLGGIVGGIVGGAPVPTIAPVRVGGNIKRPDMLRRVDPVYPPLARAARVMGVVILEAEVSERGIVTDVRVLRGMPLLDVAAVEAVRQWRYHPLLLNGVPMPFLVVVTVNFNLGNAVAAD